MKIKGAIFDMDGTLADSLFFWEYFWRSVGEKYFNDKDFKPAPEIDRAARTMIYKEAMTVFNERYKVEADNEDFINFAESYMDTFYRTEVKEKPGATALLKYLRANGVRVVLASATASNHIKSVMGVLGFAEYFDGVLSCADIGRGKDRPDIYLAAIDALGLPICDIAVFEDSCVALETAASIGLHTVGIYDEHNFGHDRLKQAAEIYVDKGESLEALIGKVSV